MERYRLNQNREKEKSSSADEQAVAALGMTLAELEELFVDDDDTEPEPNEEPSCSSGVVNVRVHLHHETEDGIAVSRTGPGTHPVWLPRRHTTLYFLGLSNSTKERMRAEGRPREDFWPWVVQVPRWLARRIIR